MSSFTIDVAASSRKGAMRARNEDSFLVGGAASFGDGSFGERLQTSEDAPLVLMVSDGIGGGHAGDAASRLAVETMSEEMGRNFDRSSVESHIEAGLHEASNRIRSRAEALGRSGEMGATATVAVVIGSNAFIGQVGDSRAYRYRRGMLHRLTKDQSLVSRLIDTGNLTESEARYHPHRNVILQALGIQEHLEPDFTRSDLAPGDVLLLCSDGLTAPLTEEHILELLSQALAPELILDHLLQAALAAGAEDDVTVVVAKVGPRPAPEARNGGGAVGQDTNQTPRSWWGRFFGAGLLLAPVVSAL